MESDANKVKYVLHVQRGNLHVNVPLTGMGVLEKAADIAQLVVASILHVQAQFPGRATHPVDPTSKMPLALKLPEADRPLRPNISLKAQLRGHWMDMDVQGIGAEGLTDEMAHAAVCVVELVDTLQAI